MQDNILELLKYVTDEEAIIIIENIIKNHKKLISNQYK